MDLVFADPDLSFIWGDLRCRDALPGNGCGGPARRFHQFRSFCHIQSNNPFTYLKANSNGDLVKLDWETAGPLKKVEPMLSYTRCVNLTFTLCIVTGCVTMCGHV